MKKYLVSLMSLFLIAPALAEDFDFSNSDSVKKEVSIEKLKYSIEIQGNLLVFNKTGTRLLYTVEEDRRWKFGGNKPIVSYWNVTQKGLPASALQHEWQLTPQGELQLKIKQFESMKREKNGEIKTGKLMQEKDIPIENMTVPSIVLHQDDNRRVVAQFKIQIWPTDDNAEDIGRLGINSGRMTIFDTKGNLWASRIDNSTGNNVYFAARTHMGTVYLSYVPFKGARKIGIAEKNRIRVEDNGVKLHVESSDFLLPRGIQANVYGYINVNVRTDRVNSIRSCGSDKESAFLENASCMQ